MDKYQIDLSRVLGYSEFTTWLEFDVDTIIGMYRIKEYDRDGNLIRDEHGKTGVTGHLEQA